MNTKDQLHVLNEPIISSIVKALKETLNRLVVQVLTKAKLEDPLKHQEKALVYLIHVQEGPNPPLFEPRSFDNKTFNFILALAMLIM